MAEILNDQNLRALDLVPPKGFLDFSPLHVVEYQWPFQPCKVSVVHSFERDLTILEKFTLRSIRDIPQVTSSEICERLALVEGDIIEETIKSLLEANSIELKRYSEVGSGKGTFDNYEFEITQYGKDLLSKGKITQPDSTREYDLVRSIPGGLWMGTTGNGFDKHDLGPEHLKHEYTVPNSEQVTKALVESDQFDDELVIQNVSPEEGYELESFQVLKVCIVLAVSQKGKGIRFFAFLWRSGMRLKWMEAILNSDPNFGDEILTNHFCDKYPPNQNGLSEPSSSIRPLMHFNRLVNEECGAESKGVVVLRNRKKLFDIMGGSTKSMERLLSNRTSMEIKPGFKGGIQRVDDGPPLRYECGSFDAELPDNSVSTPNCTFYLTNISIESPLGGKTYELPTLFKDRKMGKRVAEEANSRFSGEETTSLDRFLFSKSETNLIIWINDMVSEINEIQDVSGIADDAWKHTRGTGYGVSELIIESISTDRKDLFAEDWVGSSLKLMESVEKSSLEIEGGGWRFIERRIQQAALESSMAPGSDSTSPLSRWQDHNSGESHLPWEDAARLEWKLFGKCDGTRLDVIKQFQDVIVMMASSRNLAGEKISNQLAELERAGVIDSELKKRCDSTRKLRNKFIHEVNISAETEYTLSSIATMRDLASIDSVFDSLKDERWSKPTRQDWENSLGVGELERYITHFMEIHKKASSEEREFNGSIWVESISEILPLEYSEIPMEVIRRLSKCPELDGPPQFNSLIEPILSTSLKYQLKSMPAADSLRIPEPIKKISTELKKLGLEEQSRNLIKKSIQGSPSPKDLDELQEELDSASTPDFVGVINESDLRSRWITAINAMESCELAELATITESQLESLGKRSLNALFKKSLNTAVGKYKLGAEVAVVLSTCESINSLMEVNDKWLKAVRETDGLIGDRVGKTLNRSKDKIKTAAEIESMMPLVDEKILPKTHKRLKTIISRGDKEKKKR